MAGDSTPREATREEMRDAKLPLAYRDSCAHLLIPLNRCRVDSWYLPWKCNVRLPSPPMPHSAAPGASPPRPVPTRPPLRDHDERHSYEKCQYDEFKKRVAKMNELRAEKGTRSN
ncbi:NADH dehydrogenase [ubiquinone] 1 beta subcomplex subunit 7 [Colletotrichum spaethianum]|uniref:NADH dehydrogenase [ubiquinone] 1 beta subcomplex subunit 7 n=1 Tax=Colletotrichum spaethianum TaxID=700344 RepID=A0AA37LAJ6_9PEZI|nr:NADH dehydrogenase [ubiquinone] 1 beta subcomplex subunit 7 [Colletotrichum spaethianum]GKT44833.1 NADH dehydrogenase [ubiquinone] 1 beta subcomplex subunit 7 [Colletotrichum spaethianum]